MSRSFAVTLSLPALITLACSGSLSTAGTGGAPGTGAATGTGGHDVYGTGGQTTRSCTADRDCAPASCGKCPDGSTLCPTTQCRNGACVSAPVSCTQCRSDADCPAASCTVCLDGQLVCNRQHCTGGLCGSNTVVACASKTGPTCQSPADCTAPVCANCPDGAKVCTSSDCANGMCRSGSTACNQCAANSDCGKPLCDICWDGSTVCSTPTCRAGQCASDAHRCPERPTGAPLLWHWTCGDPVCQVPNNDGGASDASALCPNAGTPCSQRGATCGDGSQSCGAVLVCEDYDPTVGGCPVSSAKFKNDISYLGDADLERLRAELMDVRLATYEYKPEFTHDPGVEHLGFIVEDMPDSPAVDRGHDRVDLYGYVSMVVATMQVQQKEIRELHEEIGALRRAAQSCQGASGKQSVHARPGLSVGR